MIDGKNMDLYLEDSVYKQMNIEVVGTDIVIDNSMREQDTFTLTETLCDSSELKFGSCLPNQITFVGREIPSSIKGKKLHPVETLEGNEDDPFEYGEYTVYSDVPTSDRTKREIKAYDAMYDIINADMKSWYAGLLFPMTLKSFRDSFFAYLGIEQKETVLVNDDMTINKTLITSKTDSESTITEESSISGKTVVEAICEINGVFGNINRDGLFEYVELKPIITPLYPSNDLYPRDDLFPREANSVSLTGHYITFDYEDFWSKSITQLEIRPSDDSAGVIVGTSGNNYVISGNFLVSDKSGAELESIAENILSVIKKAAYVPIKSSQIVGNPCLELGDPIRFNTSREIVESYVLQRTLTGIQSKRDSITSLGTEIHSTNVNSIKDTISNVERRTNKLERTADHTLSELANLDESTSSRFEQTAEQIQSEVTRATSAETTLQSSITQNAESISTEVANRQSADSNLSTQISQTAHSVALTASGGNNSVGITIQLYDENGNLIDTDSGNANINIVGFVSFSDLAGEGTTTINGKNIKTGTISCDLLDGGTIEGQTFYGGYIYSDDIVCGKAFYMNSGIPMLGSGTVDKVKAFYLDRVNRVCFDNDIVANVFGNLLGNAYTATTASCATRCGSGDYYMYFTGANNFVPSSSEIQCGTSPNPFNKGYSVNGWNTTSDERVKKDFVPLEYDERFEYFFYLLDPMEYRLISDTDGVVHIGFVAQRVKDAMNACGIREDEFYGFHHNYVDVSEFDSQEQYQAFLERNQGNTDTYSLCYEEFIALNTHMIQKQHKEIESLKQENLALQNRLSILEQKMEVLYNAYNNQNN